jgi:hypothetical protein
MICHPERSLFAASDHLNCHPERSDCALAIAESKDLLFLLRRHVAQELSTNS